MPLRRFDNDPDDSQFALEKTRAARIMRRLYKPAEIIRAQVVAIPEADTVQILTPQLSYRFVRKPTYATVDVGDYVSVLNPGGENSTKIWEIINVVTEHPIVYDYSQDTITNNTYNTTYTSRMAVIGTSIDAGSYVITTGLKGYVRVPASGTLRKWTILAHQSGAIVIDVWKDTFANFPPTDADSITGGNEPEITATGDKAEDETLTGWNLTVTEGDVFAFNVDSVTSIQKAIIQLEYERDI